MLEAQTAYNQQTPEATLSSTLPSNVIPESVFKEKLHKNNQKYEIIQENLVSPEEYITELGANKGSERWAISNSVNKHTDFIKLFASTRAHLEANEARKNVGIHELGHAHVVKDHGGTVEEISIVPQGRTLGFTKYRLHAMRDLVRSITTRIACAAGSRIAEEKAGIHDHCGCGGDDGQIRSLAMTGERYTAGMYSSSWFESEGRKQARQSMASYSATDLEKDALSLLQKTPVHSNTEPKMIRRKIITLKKPIQKAA